jgi:hypothetical protein
MTKEKTETFELAGSVLLALELAPKAMGRIMRADGGIRLLFAKVAAGPVDPITSLGGHIISQHRIIEVNAGINNPFGDEPHKAVVKCHLFRQNETWFCDKADVIITTESKEKHYCFSSRELGVD